ncbi:c-type cytochrome domain-containing protein [Pontiella sulfatireligans]|uniref:c-type cytochrome domain-containing protein n=1 Tax=Pontiella sulfatireligans TaxID=2750658 RepID=UPI00109C44AC|nr:c-type cytochrome domain-containing protein [Pontiella sulfatireligans]
MIFDAVIRPLLEEKCIFCHGVRRSRGGLNMTSLETIQAGGSEGPAIVNGSAADSLLVQRIDLPESSDKHMPPAGEPQLSPEELAFLRWWIGYGLDAAMDDLPPEHARLAESFLGKNAE